MKVVFTKDFHKQYKKVNVRVQNSVDEQIRLFRRNPKDLQLNNHKLLEPYKGCRSIDITVDYRAIYEEKEGDEEKVAYFVALGTHDELYKPIAD